MIKTKTVKYYTTTLTPVDVQNVPENGIHIEDATAHYEENGNRILITNAGTINLANDSVYRNFVHSILPHIEHDLNDDKYAKEWVEKYLNEHLTTRELMRSYKFTDWDIEPSEDAVNYHFYLFQDVERKVWKYALNNEWVYKSIIPYKDGGYYPEQNPVILSSSDRTGRQYIAKIKSVGCEHKTSFEMIEKEYNARPEELKGKKKIYLNAPASRSPATPEKLTITAIIKDEDAIVFKEPFYTSYNDIKSELYLIMENNHFDDIQQLIGTTLIAKTTIFTSSSRRSYIPDEYTVYQLDSHETNKDVFKRIKKGLIKLNPQSIELSINNKKEEIQETKGKLKQAKKDLLKTKSDSYIDSIKWEEKRLSRKKDELKTINQFKRIFEKNK